MQRNGSTTNKPPPPQPPSSSSSSYPQQRQQLPQSPATFSESLLPSVKSNHLSITEESNLRFKTCRFIEEACRILKLPRLVISSAIVLFHRFYAVHSFEDHDRFEVAVACILLAAKTEESPKKLATVILECYRLKMVSARRGKSGGSGDDGILDVNGEEFLRLKERTLLLERVILHTIGFELSIDHPHKFLAEQASKMVKKLEFIKPPDSTYNQLTIPEKNAKMIDLLVRKAVSFANDSMLTKLCLQYPASQIAAAILYMSAQSNKMKPAAAEQAHSQQQGGGFGGWIEILPVMLDMDSFISIVKQIIELIADKKGEKVDREVFDTIEADLKILKRATGSATSGGGGGERDAKRRRA